jgi:hypothetical protein
MSTTDQERTPNHDRMPIFTSVGERSAHWAGLAILAMTLVAVAAVVAVVAI